MITIEMKDNEICIKPKYFTYLNFKDSFRNKGLETFITFVGMSFALFAIGAFTNIVQFFIKPIETIVNFINF